jgi:hypothetical protein
MAHLGAKIVMKVVTIGVSIPVGLAARTFVEKVWVAAGPDRPREAKDNGVQWVDAISWAALTGITTAAADLLSRKFAEEVYHTIIGQKPPVTARPTASRKVRKAKPKYPAAIAPPT